MLGQRGKRVQDDQDSGIELAGGAGSEERQVNSPFNSPFSHSLLTFFLSLPLLPFFPSLSLIHALSISTSISLPSILSPLADSLIHSLTPPFSPSQATHCPNNDMPKVARGPSALGSNAGAGQHFR